MKTIVFKISGEALGSKGSVYDKKVIDKLLLDIKYLSKFYKVAFVLGGGNLMRGSFLTKNLRVTKSIAHFAGMLAIVNNGIVLRDLMQQAKMSVKLLSGISVIPEVEQYSYSKAQKYIKNNIILFVGGTGLAYFTSDTTAVHRAVELDADLLVMAKSVDSVYTADPKIDKLAKKIKKITCTKILADKLIFADATSIALAREEKMSIKLVNLKNLRNFDKAIGTIITPK